MAIQALKTIKNWFRTGLKPTQTQFWDTWDSFRHKNEKIPVKDIEGIDELLNSKTDESDFKTINGESILGFGDIMLTNENIVQSVKGINVDNTDPQNPIIRGNGEIKGEFKNSKEAILAGLVEGDLYNLPINAETNNAIVCVVKKLQGSILRLTFDDINATCSEKEITNKLNIEDWNSYFISQSSSVFDSVIISGNTATFTGSGGMQLIFLYNMGINELEILNGFEYCQYMYLTGNNISKMPDISTLSSLNGFALNRNNLTDFVNDISLPDSLRSLSLDYNRIVNFDPTGLNDGLEAIFLNNNSIETFNPSIKLPSNLKSIHLYNNNIELFDPSISLPDGLTSLWLNANKISVFDPSIALPSSLEELQIGSNLLTNFNPSIPMPSNLLKLELSHNQITKFDPINAITSLKSLFLINNKFTEITPAISLNEGLEYLFMGANQIKDISTFNIPIGLKTLEINQNLLTAFNPVLPPTLETIILTGNPIGNFNPSSDLNNLKYLYLGNTSADKFNPSSTLNSLILLELSTNAIDFDWSLINWIVNVPNAGQLYHNGAATGTPTATALLAKSWNLY